MLLLMPVFWFFPWWGLPLIAAGVGVKLRGGLWRALQFSLAAGLISVAFAFTKDGRTQGLVSKRLMGLFSLPAASLSFALMFGVIFVTAFLCFFAGAELARLFKFLAKLANPHVSKLENPDR